MPVEAVLLDLASTVSHAGWNARLHRLADPVVVIAALASHGRSGVPWPCWLERRWSCGDQPALTGI